MDFFCIAFQTLTSKQVIHKVKVTGELLRWCMVGAGIENEFMFTGRLDNLGMSYCSLAALLDCYPTEGHLADESAIKAIALFDHEEVGSASAQGQQEQFHACAL